MKNTVLILLCSMVFNINVKSQVYCEMDLVYSSFNLETGCRMIQTSDSNFVVFSVGGQMGSLKGEAPKFFLTKINTCGNVLWRSASLNSGDGGSEVSSLFENQDGSIMFSGNLKSGNGKVIHLHKTSSTGILLWKVQIGNNAKDFKNIRSIKLSNNKLLHFGSFRNSSTEYYKPIAIFSDTLGNTLYEHTSTLEGQFTAAVKMSENNILILGMEDTSMSIINMDTIGVILRRVTFPKISNWGLRYFIPNKEGTRLLWMTDNYTSRLTRFAHLDLNGNLIKDSIFSQEKFPDLFYPKSQINPLENNSYLIPGDNIVFIDSNLHIIWENTWDKTLDPYFRRLANYSIVSSDSSVVSVGIGHFRTEGIGNLVSDFWLGKKGMGKIVKMLTINGNEIINKKHDTVKFSAIVLPESAINKIVLWEVNDTNLATITQTGLLTAKANGVVTVTATTTDGSNLSAQKVITITNQNVGLEANSQLFQNIKIYPNPVKDYFEVDDAGLGIETLEMLNVNGEVIYSTDVSNCTNPCMFSTLDLSNGIYFIRFHSDTASVLKKIAVFR